MVPNLGLLSSSKLTIFFKLLSSPSPVSFKYLSVSVLFIIFVLFFINDLFTLIGLYLLIELLVTIFSVFGAIFSDLPYTST